jgi:hypothetical protein
MHVSRQPQSLHRDVSALAMGLQFESICEEHLAFSGAAVPSIPGIEATPDFLSYTQARGAGAFGVKIPLDGSGAKIRCISGTLEFPPYDYNQNSDYGDEPTNA